MSLFLSEQKLNEIRGKSMVGKATPDEILSVFDHLDSITEILDESDCKDTFGTEGWREFFGLSE